jgi:pimeloyl-ACP methyl ester carboxylesterase
MDDWPRDELTRIVRRLGIAGDTASPTRSQVTASDGVALNLLDWGGDGPPALLLHGGSLTARTWDYVCVGLRERWRLVALDQRGHGDSGRSDAFAVSRLARDALEVVEALDLAPVRLVGMSLGGLVAAEAAALDPELIRSLTIVDVTSRPVVGGADRMRGFMAGMLGAPSVEAVVEAALRISPLSDRERVAYRMAALLRRDPSGVWVWKHAAYRHADFLHVVARVEAMGETLAAFPRPVLLVRGGRSLILTRPAAEAFVAELPCGCLVEIDDAGHNVQEDQPLALIAALEGFWRGVAASGPAQAVGGADVA